MPKFVVVTEDQIYNLEYIAGIERHDDGNVRILFANGYNWILEGDAAGVFYEWARRNAHEDLTPLQGLSND